MAAFALLNATVLVTAAVLGQQRFLRFLGVRPSGRPMMGRLAEFVSVAASKMLSRGAVVTIPAIFVAFVYSNFIREDFARLAPLEKATPFYLGMEIGDVEASAVRNVSRAGALYRFDQAERVLETPVNLAAIGTLPAANTSAAFLETLARAGLRSLRAAQASGCGSRKRPGATASSPT